MDYLMLITYSFDTDYVAKPCATEDEAITELNKYLNEEIETVKKECEFTPIVIRYSDDEVKLVYTNNKWDYVNEEVDTATYKVIEIGHGVV